MRRKKLKGLLFCLVFVLGLTACGGKNKVKEGDSFVYCMNTDKTGLVKNACEIQGDGIQEKAESVLKEMQESTDETQCTPALPKEVKVLWCTLKGSILEVNFSEEYKDTKPLEEKLMRVAIVQSLLQLDGVNAVSILVEGAPLQDESGENIGLLNEDDFVQNTDSLSSYQTGTITLYFANKNGDKLVEQTMDVRYSSNVSKEKLIVEKLMQGPVGTDVYPTINPKTNLLSVSTKDGICYVNFDSTFLTSAYDVLPEITIYSLVNSIVNGTDATRVQITINGESKAKYMEKVDLSEPLGEEMEWIAVKNEK